MSESLNRKLQSIGVRTERATGNIAPLLHEIRHAVRALAEHGTTGAVDLRSIPLAEGEEDRILGFLGTGEVVAQIEALGRSEIRETNYPGIWIVTHFDDMGDVKARFIEITYVPQILCSQPADIHDALERLETALHSL
jgi:hydrogenase-1 operon protein HyaF